MPVQINASLVLVTGPGQATGGRDDWDGAAAPAGADPDAPTKWEGAAPAYYRETTTRAPGAGGEDVTFVRVLYVDTPVARAAELTAQDSVRFVGPDGSTIDARAAVVAMSDLAEIPAELRTTRIELEST